MSQFLFGRFNRFVTTGFLPPEVRREMKLDWDDERQRKFDKTVRFFGKLMKVLPRPIRQVAYSAPLRDFRRRLAKGQPLV